MSNLHLEMGELVGRLERAAALSCSKEDMTHLTALLVQAKEAITRLHGLLIVTTAELQVANGPDDSEK